MIGWSLGWRLVAAGPITRLRHEGYPRVRYPDYYGAGDRGVGV